jgi:hypothetical protein
MEDDNPYESHVMQIIDLLEKMTNDKMEIRSDIPDNVHEEIKKLEEQILKFSELTENAVVKMGMKPDVIKKDKEFLKTLPKKDQKFFSFLENLKQRTEYLKKMMEEAALLKGDEKLPEAKDKDSLRKKKRMWRKKFLGMDDDFI